MASRTGSRATRGSRRWPGEAGGGRGLSGARHASVLLARRKTTGGVEMGWAVLGQVSGRQVTSFSLPLLFISVLFCFFYLVATEFKFKQI